jgi:formylglycine-generating enzyme required for sulfatase activity
MVCVLLALSAPPVRSEDAQAGIRWVTIPGGDFSMGAGAEEGRPESKPAHRVAIKSFQMSKTMVTNKQYAACVAAGACVPAHFSDGSCYAVWNGRKWEQGKVPPSFQGDDQPVVCVDWAQAKAFAAWAGGRLPSEAEWEYAARGAGKDRKYPWGRHIPLTTPLD